MKKIFSLVLSSVLVFGLSLVLSGCSSKSVYTYDGVENYLSGNVELDVSELHTIDVDWVSGNVTVEYVEGIDKILVEETSRYTILNNEELRYNLSDDGVLTIKFRNSSLKKVNLTKEKSLHIKLPQSNAVRNKLIINTVSADAYVNRIDADKIGVSSVSGKITIINSKTSVSDVVSASGDISLKNSTLNSLSVNGKTGNIECLELTSDKLVLVNVSGDTTMDLLSTPIAIDAETVSGNIDLKIVNKKGFTATFESVSGNFNCGFDTVLNENRYIYLDGVYEYNFETVSGNVNLQKK